MVLSTVSLACERVAFEGVKSSKTTIKSVFKLIWRSIESVGVKICLPLLVFLTTTPLSVIGLGVLLDLAIDII